MRPKTKRRALAWIATLLFLALAGIWAGSVIWPPTIRFSTATPETHFGANAGCLFVATFSKAPQRTAVFTVGDRVDVTIESRPGSVRWWPHRWPRYAVPGGILDVYTVPLWPAVLLSLLLAAWLWWRVRRLGLGPGLCQRCGYSLAGLAPGALCPECGRAE